MSEAMHGTSGRRRPNGLSDSWLSLAPTPVEKSSPGSGENISSVEIEGVLLQHAAVQEVAVVGMADEKWGESPHAFVVLRAGATVADGELRRFVRDRLAHFKCPQAFHLVTDLPKTATGKVQKFVLRGNRAGIATQ